MVGFSDRGCLLFGLLMLLFRPTPVVVMLAVWAAFFLPDLLRALTVV